MSWSLAPVLRKSGYAWGAKMLTRAGYQVAWECLCNDCIFLQLNNVLVIKLTVHKSTMEMSRQPFTKTLKRTYTMKFVTVLLIVCIQFNNEFLVCFEIQMSACRIFTSWVKFLFSTGLCVCVVDQSLVALWFDKVYWFNPSIWADVDH